jgi:hypothetical protein
LTAPILLLALPEHNLSPFLDGQAFERIGPRSTRPPANVAGKVVLHRHFSPPVIMYLLSNQSSQGDPLEVPAADRAA